MRSAFVYPFVIFFFMVSVISCTGPQMINTPPEVEAPVVVKKKSEVNTKENEKLNMPEDQGVFDDDTVKLKTDLKEWKLIEDKDGIQSYEKVKSSSGLVAFRGEIFIPASIKKVLTILINDDLQKQWVDSLVEARKISEKNESEKIEYTQTKVPWPFQNRDFVFRVNGKINPQPATMLITMKSVVDPAAPLVDGVVRGEIIHSYYYLKESPQLRATRMVVEMEVDPKGEIPLWMVNLSQKSWPHNTLAAVKRLALREDILILPKVDHYFEVIKEKLKKTKKGKNK